MDGWMDGVLVARWAGIWDIGFEYCTNTPWLKGQKDKAHLGYLVLYNVSI
jgi:hypothetical protein